MKPREPGTPPLGQLLVDRGVLTSTQLYQISLEQRVTGKPLGEIIMERGLASSDVLKSASGGGTEAPPPEPEPSAEVDPPARDEERPRGLRERAARRLDEYLATTAAELDQRGETLGKRSRALEQKAAQLTAAESELERRARRLRDLGIGDENVSHRIDQLLQVVAGRDAQIEAMAQERDRARKEVASAREQLAAREAEAAQRQHLLAEKDERAGALARELQAARAKLDSASNELERNRHLQTENAALKASREEAEGVLVRLRQSQTAQAEELAHARQLLEERSRRTSELERALAEAQATPAATQHEPVPGGRELEIVEHRSQTTHLLHVPGTGCYALIERPGPPPQVGDRISQDKHGQSPFVVTRVGASPLPQDERTCAYLQPQ